MNVSDLRSSAKFNDMDAMDEFWSLGFTHMSHLYNGIGPEWMPKKYRDKATEYFEFQEEACLIHDIENSFRFKTEDQFKEWNDRLYSNMLLKIKNETKKGHVFIWRFWSKNSVFRLRLRAKFLYRMCDQFGHDAFFNIKEVE